VIQFLADVTDITTIAGVVVLRMRFASSKSAVTTLSPAAARAAAKLLIELAAEAEAWALPGESE